jgi:AraC-like DNA-binding protein
MHIPLHVIAPLAGGLDAILVSAISAPEPLSMLRRYVDGLLDSFGLERPETLNLAVAHVHEIVSYILGAARDRAEAEKARGPGAARLRAIKADIVENACSREFTIVSVAERHQVTPRYVRKLFEGEGVTFSEFVLAQRLARARRMLADPRHDAETISAIAFACGFGDLSYFNRVFRRQYGATPTAVREAARRGGLFGSTDTTPARGGGVECSAAADLERIPVLMNRDALSIHALAHLLVGEPVSTSPGHALEHFPEKWTPVFRRKCDLIYLLAISRRRP